MEKDYKLFRRGDYIHVRHRYSNEHRFIQMPKILLAETRIYDHNEKEGILKLNINPKQIDRILSQIEIDTSRGINILLIEPFCSKRHFLPPMYIDGVRKIAARQGCEDIADTPLTEKPKKKGEEGLFCRLRNYLAG